MSTTPRSDAVDLYELLEISPSARPEVVHAAYKALARACHPDVSHANDAPVRMRELNRAYQVLSDPARRATYDLERTRQRRRERLLAPTEQRAIVPARRPPVARSAAVTRRTSTPAVEERLWSVNAQVLVGLAALAAVVALMLLILWVGVSLSDDGPAFGGSVIEIRDRPPVLELRPN